MATNVNTDIADKKINRSAMIRLYESKTDSAIMVEYNGHVERLDNLIRNSKIKKLDEKLYAALDKELTKTFGGMNNISKRYLMDLTNDQMSFTYGLFDKFTGRIWNSKRPPKRISEEIVLENPLYKNVTLEQGWTNINMNARKNLESIIRRGIAENQTENEIANAIVKSTYHKVNKIQALGLTRTAITSVVAQADQEVYKANAKILTGWQYVAVLDSRTTPLCAFRDGHIYPVEDTEHLPPAHFNCRSTTVPVVKSYNDLKTADSIAQIRKTNFEDLSPKQIAYYDGQTPLQETYDQWLRRQPTEVQLQHIGDWKKLEIFRSGELSYDKFITPEGKEVGIKELRRLTDTGYGIPGETRKFALAKEKLDTLKLYATKPEDFFDNKELQNTLKEYYVLQAGELDGNLALTNYRGALLHTKKAMKYRVLSTPPTEDNMRFNPLTGRYEDMRIYQPHPGVLRNTLRLVEESDKLKPQDKQFITNFVDGLSETLDANQRAVISDNLRIIFTRFRDNGEQWGNLKAVIQGQIKFDVMNVSDYIETQIRRDQNLLLRLKQAGFVDPVLGATQIQDLYDTFISNIIERNKIEDNKVPKLARKLRSILDYKLYASHPMIMNRIPPQNLDEFYKKFVYRLGNMELPDRDQLAISLGRDLYNMANYNGSRNEWWKLGVKLLDDAKDKGFYELETFGIQKRRIRSRMSGQYFGPYYDTYSVNIRILHPVLQRYFNLNRKIDVGLRLGVTTDKNRLIIRKGYKTYFDIHGNDTRIPIISSTSYKDFPKEFIDQDITDALNWASSTKYRIDEDYYDFVDKLLKFEDDKGKAKYYHELNKYREFMVERGDSYERFKSIEWLRRNNYSFSNHPYMDHRGRIYERGMIGPQSGEAFRPFLNSEKSRLFSPDEFYDFQDQIGSFIGGISDTLEGKFNSLSIRGRQGIAEKWRPTLIEIGNHMRRNKPNDIRKVLDSEFLAEMDGEEQAKVLRFALEMAKIDEYLGGNYSAKNLEKLKNYSMNMAIEQDASSSGAQIIALTTRNKQLAELSNVVPTDQKKRLYDEIAALTFNDPRFRELNLRLGLTEKDLRKAAKAQNMVTLYGAGERTGAMNVEKKLADVLEKEEGTLIVKASERNKILDEISAKMARYERYDPYMYDQLKALRQDVKDILNKGQPVGEEIMEQLWFLDPKSRDVLEKLSRSYNKVVTPDDFSYIAKIMSEYLAEQTPILKDFTRYLGRLSEDFLLNAKPSESAIDTAEVIKQAAFGARKKGERLPSWLSEILAIRDEPIRDKILRRIPLIDENGFVANFIFGAEPPKYRRTGFKVGKYSIFSEDITPGFEVLYPNKLPKKWTQAPWVNFDGKVVEQHFTQVFEERLNYRDKDGKWITNILQVPQKTSATWWEEFRNKSDKIYDIADTTKSRTAFAVNGNHSNDAVIVKQFHLWGKKNKIPTSTVHDAFLTNAADMLKARRALQEIYANAVDTNTIYDTLVEMKKRGLPDKLYKQYLNEAIEKGLIPVAGKSKINGKLMTEDDILKREDILRYIPTGFNQNYSWYGVG